MDYQKGKTGTLRYKEKVGLLTIDEGLYSSTNLSDPSIG